VATLNRAERSQLIVFASVIVALHVAGWGLVWFVVGRTAS